MNQISEKPCPICSTSPREIFFELSEMPAFCNLLWKERQAALNCAKGDIKLAFCHTCGFIDNVAFDSAKIDYTEDYECSLDFSPRFQSYARSLAEDLVARHQLRNKKIIEIGSGKGDFLLLLCQQNNNYGIGFDPTYVYRPEHDQYQVEFVRDYYSEKYAHYQSDLIICRHTLEHIPNPANFLTILRRNIGNTKPKIFFEVPNALYTFHDLGIWDIIYEHCCYFSSVSLSNAFTSCGFQVTNTKEEYRGQFLCLEAIPNKNTQNLNRKQTKALSRLQHDVINFRSKFQQKVDYWKAKLQKIAPKNQRVVLWGAGSKGVTFLNIFRERPVIKYVVDINPYKKNKYIPGTGQQIVAPNFLINYQPDIVIVANSIYENEIRQMLTKMSLTPQIFS